MKLPDIPVNELERLSELKEYSLLDSLPEEDYEIITRLASQICDTPIALITLLDKDRQWFKSTQGLGDIKETPREYSFCAHAINNPQEIMVVPDSRKDDRFFDNPFVTNPPSVIFYAGVPLVTSNGNALGTLCVIDHEPKVLSAEQLTALKALSNSVIRFFELRRSKLELEKTQVVLQEKNKELERFAGMAAHDLKSPLGNISSIIDLLVNEHAQELGPEAVELIGLMDESSKQLRDMIDGILEYTRTDMLLLEKREEILFPKFFSDVASLLPHHKKHELYYPKELMAIQANKPALKQIMLNLINNALNYNDKELPIITISFEESPSHYRISVADNGPGIAPEHQERIFNLFERLPSAISNGTTGYGIGLSTVKKLVERLGGEITVDSKLGEGATFTFTFAK